MYIAIVPNNVIIKPTLKGINKKLESALEEKDFKSLGKFRVADISKENLEFVKDLKIMQSIPMKTLYKKETLIPILLGINIMLTFILLVKG